MSQWPNNPSWTDISDINNGQEYSAQSGMVYDDMNKIVRNLAYLKENVNGSESEEGTSGNVITKQLWSGSVSVNPGSTSEINVSDSFATYDLFKINISFSAGYFSGNIWGQYASGYGILARGTWYVNGSVYDVFLQISQDGTITFPSSIYRQSTSSSFSTSSGSIVVNRILGIKLY